MAACNDGQQASKDLEALLVQTATMVAQLKEHHDVLQMQSERIQKLTTAVTILREAVKRGKEVQDTVDSVSSAVRSLLTQDEIKKHELATILDSLKELAHKVAELEALKSGNQVEHDRILENKHTLDLLHKELESVQDDCDRARSDRDRQFGDLNDTIKELKKEVDDTQQALRYIKWLKSLLTWLVGILGTGIATLAAFSDFFAAKLPQ